MSYDGRKNNLTGNTKSDEWYTPRFLVEKCYSEVRKFYVNPIILCPFDTEESEFVKVGKEYGYNLEFNIVGNMDYEYDLLLTNPPFSINSFEMCLETKKDFMLIIPETFVFSVGFYKLLEKYRFNYKLFSPKQRVYFIDQNGKQNRPNFHTVIIYVSKYFTENIIEHFYSETKQLTHQHEDKGEEMEVRKFERYGNECIIYTTLILDDDVLIVIERFVGGWCNNTPSVSVYDENAQEKFEELVKEFEDKGE